MHSQEEVHSSTSSFELVEEAEKNSQLGSTCGDSFGHTEAQMETSLKHLIFKTKILRAMLEKQMISAQLMKLSERTYESRTSLGGFIM